MSFLRALRFPCPIALLIAVLLHANAAPSFAQGTARSLDIQPGARQNALGAAGVALFGDPSDAMWWNPAALGFADRFGVTYTHASLVPGLGDIPYDHVAAGSPLGSRLGLGVSSTRLDYGRFYGDEASIAMALGVRVHPMVSIGATLKSVNVDLGIASGSTTSSDVGVLLRMDRGPWRFGFGAMYQNLGGSIDFSAFSPPSPLSRNYKIGTSATVQMLSSEDATAGLTAVVDYNQSDVTPDFTVWNGGLEAYLAVAGQLRVAGRAGYYYDDLGDLEDFTYGVGIRAWMLAFDAAWIPQARDSGLDDVVKLTFGAHMDLSQGRPKWRMD